MASLDAGSGDSRARARGDGPSRLVLEGSARRWNEAIGRLWARILERNRLDREGTVVEVGPGFADKIGRGLAQLRFAGTLLVVEPCAAPRDWVVESYRSLLPRAKIVPLAGDIGTVRDLPERAEGLFMNHVIDDLMLGAALPPGRASALFSEMVPGGPCSPDLRLAWRRLGDDRRLLEATSRRVVRELCALVSAIRPRLVVMSHYASWYQRTHGLETADRLAQSVLVQLRDRLGGTTPGNRRLLARLRQDPGRWFVSDRDWRSATS